MILSSSRRGKTILITGRVFCGVVLASCSCAAAPPTAAQRGAGREMNSLFQNEIQQCSVKLKWRGERLPDDTIYAAALTGLSWLDAWNPARPFSLAWGNCDKIPASHKRNTKQTAELTSAVQEHAHNRNWRQAVGLATENFSDAEIGCNPALKEAVSESLLALNQPERALNVLLKPFDAGRAGGDVPSADRKFRRTAFAAAEQAAQQSGEDSANWRRTAIALGLSLLLEPGTPTTGGNLEMLRYLEKQGVDIDRTLLGILQSPERLRGLTNTWYAAADLLTLRATPRQLPFLMHLAQSDDVYLRADAVIGLGLLAYQPRRNDTIGWQKRIISTPLQEYGLSVGERKMIDQEIKEAAESDKYRLRTAAALALALTGDDANLKLLQKLAQDPAYLLSAPDPHNRNAPRSIQFPVRLAAAAALARYGVLLHTAGGSLAGKALEQAKRGGQDATNDRRNLRKDTVSQIAVSPVYILLPMW